MSLIRRSKARVEYSVNIVLSPFVITPLVGRCVAKTYKQDKKLVKGVDENYFVRR